MNNLSRYKQHELNSLYWKKKKIIDDLKHLSAVIKLYEAAAIRSLRPSPAQSKEYETEVGSTSEQFCEQGYENLVVNKRIDPVENWGIAVPDKDLTLDK